MSLVNPNNVTSGLSENSLQGFPNFKAVCFKFTPLTLPSAPLEQFATSADKGTRNQTDLWAGVKTFCPCSRNTQTPILLRHLGSRRSNPKTIGLGELWRCVCRQLGSCTQEATDAVKKPSSGRVCCCCRSHRSRGRLPAQAAHPQTPVEPAGQRELKAEQGRCCPGIG